MLVHNKDLAHMTGNCHGRQVGRLFTLQIVADSHM